MLSKAFLKKIEEELLAQKRQLIITANMEQDIEIDTDGDEYDEIQGNLLIEMQNQLSTRNAQKLVQIETALAKLKNSTYGICDDCGEDIPEKRLLFNPYVEICVDCAEDREIEEKQRNREQS